MKKMNDDEIIMHCEVCSRSGERMAEETAIAKVKTLLFPMKKEYLAPLHEHRGERATFPGTDWKTFRCPRGNHSIFVLSMEDMNNFQKYGITRILTNRGFMRCDIKELEEKLNKVVKPGDVDDMSVDVPSPAENEKDFKPKKF